VYYYSKGITTVTEFQLPEILFDPVFVVVVFTWNVTQECGD
jgi:hypothetical protein